MATTGPLAANADVGGPASPATARPTERATSRAAWRLMRPPSVPHDGARHDPSRGLPEHRRADAAEGPSRDALRSAQTPRCWAGPRSRLAAPSCHRVGSVCVRRTRPCLLRRHGTNTSGHPGTRGPGLNGLRDRTLRSCCPAKTCGNGYRAAGNRRATPPAPSHARRQCSPQASRIARNELTARRGRGSAKPSGLGSASPGPRSTRALDVCSTREGVARRTSVQGCSCHGAGRPKIGGSIHILKRANLV